MIMKHGIQVKVDYRMYGYALLDFSPEVKGNSTFSKKNRKTLNTVITKKTRDVFYESWCTCHRQYEVYAGIFH